MKLINKVARRLVGLALASVLILPCALSLSKAHPSAPFSLGASGLTAAALLIAIVNLWLTFGRPVYMHRRHPNTRFPHVSPIPMIGTILAVAADAIAFGNFAVSIAALAALVLDVGGLPWIFIFLMWRLARVPAITSLSRTAALG